MENSDAEGKKQPSLKFDLDLLARLSKTPEPKAEEDLDKHREQAEEILDKCWAFLSLSPYSLTREEYVKIICIGMEHGATAQEAAQKCVDFLMPTPCAPFRSGTPRGPTMSSGREAS